MFTQTIIHTAYLMQVLTATLRAHGNVTVLAKHGHVTTWVKITRHVRRLAPDIVVEHARHDAGVGRHLMVAGDASLVVGGSAAGAYVVSVERREDRSGVH